MQDDTTLLKQIFEDLRIDSSSSFIKSMHLLPLYDLQAQSLQRMGHHKYLLQLLEHVVKIRETTFNENHPN